MPLHRQNCCGGISKLTNLAPSEARGGGGNGQNWQVSAPPSPKIVFLFLGYILKNAGSYFKKEKKQADSKTAILISGKNRVNPI
jgi:hypothetical protein